MRKGKPTNKDDGIPYCTQVNKIEVGLRDKLQYRNTYVIYMHSMYRHAGGKTEHMNKAITCNILYVSKEVHEQEVRMRLTTQPQ